MGVLNPVTPVYNGALVSASNPLPVTLAGAGAVIPTVTYANLPAAGTAGREYRVSNAGTKGSVWMDDGTRWKPTNGTAMLASLDTVSSNINNSEAIVFQYQMPANLLQIGDRLRLIGTALKSGTTDSLVLIHRMGTAGTTADAALFSGTYMGATLRQGGFIYDYRLESATSIQQMAGNTSGYGTTSTTAIAAAVTIANAASSSLFFDLSLRSSSTNDTVAILDAQLYLIAKAN